MKDVFTFKTFWYFKLQHIVDKFQWLGSGFHYNWLVVWMEDTPSGSYTCTRRPHPLICFCKCSYLVLCSLKAEDLEVFQAELLFLTNIWRKRMKDLEQLFLWTSPCYEFGNEAEICEHHPAIHHKSKKEMSRAKDPPPRQTLLFCCWGHKQYHACQQHKNTHTHTHLLYEHAVLGRSWGIDKSLRPERGAEVGLIEMNFRGGKDWVVGEGPN